MHFGQKWTSSQNNGDEVDMRAEVGLLTRNIKFRYEDGDEGDVGDGDEVDMRAEVGLLTGNI
jgi:hypothetical protein